MPNFRKWSQSASGNATITGGANTINWAEGMPPSAVNNSSREEMAQIRRVYRPDEWGWVEFSGTASVASQTTFRLTGNQTSDYTTGRRVRLTGGSTVNYGTIVSASFTAETTVTITKDSGSLSASMSIAAVSAAYDKNTNPSFPSAVSFSATASFGASVFIAGAFILSGDITPSQITSDQDDYAPPGHATASIIRISSDAFRSITGLQGGSDGRIAILINVGAQIIGLTHDATSTAANRFLCPGGISSFLNAGATAVLQYDSTSSRWRLLSVSLGYANQTVMEALSDFAAYVNPVNMHHHPGHPKCWGEFNGNSTTILASYNITSIADTATGIMTVTIANDFSSANWACVVSRAEDDITLVYSSTYNAKTAGVVALNSAVEAGSGSDPSSSSGNASWSFAGFGDL